jgi:hypothetical protein
MRQKTAACSRRINAIVIPIATFGALGWMAAFAFQAGDTFSGGLVIAAIVAISFVMTRHVRALPPERAARTYPVWALALGLVTLVMINWRFRAWLAVTSDTPIEEWNRRLPLWTLNLELACVFIWIEAMLVVPLWLLRRNRREDSIITPNAQKT